MMENINDTLSKKILSALTTDDIILIDTVDSLQSKLTEGKIKDQDWIIALTQKYTSALTNTDETK